MNDTNGAVESGFPNSGFTSVPAVLVALLALFFGADYAANGAMENDGYTQVLILPVVAAFAAAMGRTGAVISIGSRSIHRAVVMMAFIAVAGIISVAYNMFGSIGNLGAFTFAFVGISTFLMVNSDKREESTILLAVVIGFHLAVSHAANSAMDTSSWTGGPLELIDAERAATASTFFAFWAVSIVTGVAMALFMRTFGNLDSNESTFGNLDSPGSGSWFADLSTSPSRLTMIALGMVFAVQAVPLVWLGQITDIQTYFEHQYLGSVWALFTTAVILFVVFCHAERWRVIGTLIAINWSLYTLGHLQEIGNEFPDLLSGDDAMSTFSWFFIGFWLNVIGIMFAVRGRFGDVSPRHEPSTARIWWGQHSYGIMLALSVFVAFAIRTGWNVLPAMNASATGLWDMTGGSDPWYMKRVVDYIIAERSHFIFDHDRAYPMGAINPRPPLFSWSLALGGFALSWLLEMPAEEAVWWSVAAFPAIFGALIVLPLAAMARRIHSNTAGIVTAWLIALMPGHISHSTFGLADHDAFALLFLSMAFYFWVRAIEGLGTERMFTTPSSNPLYLVAGIRETWRRNPRTMAYATLSGISFATVALGWKGFVYGPGILFLAFAGQIALNMFRKRDSLPLTSTTLQMLLTTFLIPLPFYNWPGLNLVFDPSGFQPMFYIIGFTLALGWVSSAFRDKPWLLVLASGTMLIGGILAILYVLQELEIYNGWDILFTGGFYFSKNKIFGTIGEAQAPSRGVLFASYGPIVALIAVGCALLLMWRGAKRERQSHLLLGIWVVIATYMAWSAGRFIFNATPAMAVVGGLGIAMMWKAANFSAFVKEWRRSGIGTPRSRWSSVWPATKKNSAVPALLLVLMLVASQHATYGIDSGIPRGEPSATDVDQAIHDIAPDFLRAELLGLSVLKSESYNPDSEMWYMGTFGPGFNSGAWNLAYEWLSEQDSDVGFSERPAFVSWWDYGFQALAQGQHPTVADNFQSGIPNSGGMLLSNSQEDTLSLFITTLAQGDRRYNGGGDFTVDFSSVLSEHMTQSQLSEYDAIMSLSVGDEDFVLDRSMTVMATDDKTELLRGHLLGPDGTPESEEVWMVMLDGTQMSNSTTNETEAMELFNATRLNSAKFEIKATHYLIDDYRYTSDLIEDFNDVSTSLHRTNARLALSRAFLSSAFEMSDLSDIYHGITSLEYDVQNYEGELGEMVTRNNDIRYFAIDNRLYPLGGAYYADYQYHRGQTTGIFHAPTGLSGLDMEDYISADYQTQRGSGSIMSMTAAEYETAYLNDIVRQSSGGEATDIIRMVDIDYVQQPAFFDTMVARFYVGYSTSSLGLPGDAQQPAPHFYTTGTPGSYLENAYPLPGAMMNHFVLSNWYDNERCELLDNGSNVDENCSNPTVGSANTQVKIMKYYSGATLEGTVELEGFGPIPNARVMFERDAFSGEEVADENGDVVDGDDRTYWVPIGYADADENGHFSFTAPAGKIRVSAFIGEPDLDAARSLIMSSDVSQTLGDIFQETSVDRSVNPITGILANVSGSTWLSESIVNISGSAGHSNGLETVYGNISVSPSHATGKLVWSGAEFFDGTPLTNVSIELSPSWDRVQLAPYTVDSSSGVVEGYDLAFGGIGEVTFTGEGTVVSQGIVTVSDFTGNYTQTISHNHSLTGDGQFSGRGTLSGAVNDDVEITTCDVNSTMPENASICILEGGDYLLDGTMNATGRFTSNGSTKFVRSLSHATLVGSGEFTVNASEELDSYGTINGTFSSSEGEGIFSGPMVLPGTFHVVDAVPGDYDVTVIFEDGTRIDIDDGFNIPLVGNPQVKSIDIAGGSISGTLVDATGAPLEGAVMLLDNSSEPADAITDCQEAGTAPCLMIPDEAGDFEFGPIIPGNYTAQIDLDGDGFPEISIDYVFLAEQDAAMVFPSPVPATSDLTFRLLEDGQNVPDLNVTLRLKNGTGESVTAMFDSASGDYLAELVHGTWIMNHTLTEELQVWEQIEIGEDDIDADYEFHVSRLVMGLVYYEENLSAEFPEPDEGKILDYVAVEFHWGNFSTIAQTNGSGGFSIVLPEGAVVDATVQLPGVALNLVNGTRFTVTSDGLLVDSEVVDHLSMVAKPGHVVYGQVNINREANPYHSTYGGWEPVTVTADNLDTDVRWHGQVLPDGQFQMVLPGGNWTFDLEADWLNPVSADLEVDGKNDTVDLIVHPVNSTVTIEFFLDHSADNNASNGTYVTYPFSVVNHLDSTQTVYEIPANGTEWVSEGIAELILEPGSYRIDVEISDPVAGDPFGTRVMTGTTQFDIGLNGNTVDMSIGFDPEWRMNITFTNESGGVLADHLVRLTNVESGWMISHYTDIEGRWIAHVPEGDWIVTIDSFETSPGVREILRDIVSVSAETASSDISMSTGEVATFDLVLYEDYSEDVLDGISLLLISEDGLGTVHLDSTDSSGEVSVSVAPGNWNLELNMTEERVRWIVEPSNDTYFEIAAGENPTLNLTAARMVEFGGSVFWDFNDDNSSDIGEGVENVTVTISSADTNISLLTDRDGDWFVYVPAGTAWLIQTSIEGFSDENRTVAVSHSPNSVDVELMAGAVDVSGSISYIDAEQFATISDAVTLELIPVEGMVRDIVTPDKVLVEGEWLGNWSAQIEPGNWILRATHEGQSLIAMGLVEADVAVGDSLDLELTIGGWILLETEWLDYDGTSRTLADTDIEGADMVGESELILNIGMGMRWVAQVDEAGVLEMLLIAGVIDTSSEFEVVQRNLTMTYTGGQGLTVSPGQEAPLAVLSHARITNHEISAITLNSSGSDPEFDGGADDVTVLLDSEGEFQPVDFILGIEYLGHEPFDTFSIIGGTAGTDASNWLVEFHNGSGEWNTTAYFDMGLDNTLNFSNLNVRVTPANQSVAHSFGDGHSVTLTIMSQDGYMYDHTLTVRIPQIHGFELTEPMDESYGIQPGETISIGIKFTNPGNGDERFEFEFDDSELPDGWVRTGATSHTLGAFVDTTHTISVSAPANASDEDFKIYVSVRDMANNTYPDIEIHVQTSMPMLSIVSHELYSGGVDAVSGQMTLFSVVVKNEGLVDAQMVQLNGTLWDNLEATGASEVNGTDIRDVPANSEVVFEITLDLSNIAPATYYVQFDINQTGFDSVEEYPSDQIKIRTPPVEETTDWIGWLLGALLVAALLLLTRGGGRRRSSAPF